MLKNHPDMEKRLDELDEIIARLREAVAEEGVDPEETLTPILEERSQLITAYMRSLETIDVMRLARHARRPQTLDFIKGMCDDFFELKGDQTGNDDQAIIGGTAILEEDPVVILGHQKGREISERKRHNYGCAGPSGYRKAERLMRFAASQGVPVVTLIDTIGADCSVEAEAGGISRAIAECMATMSSLPVPIVSIVIGEGGSGGAIGIGVANRVLMMQLSYYSVIAPRSCAEILWRDGGREAEAARLLKPLAADALALHVVDEVVPEPLGGAHRDPTAAIAAAKEAIMRHLGELKGLPGDALVEQRLSQLDGIACYTER